MTTCDELGDKCICQFQEGDLVTWIHEMRGGYGYTDWPRRRCSRSSCGAWSTWRNGLASGRTGLCRSQFGIERRSLKSNVQWCYLRDLSWAS